MRFINQTRVYFWDELTHIKFMNIEQNSVIVTYVMCVGNERELSIIVLISRGGNHSRIQRHYLLKAYEKKSNLKNYFGSARIGQV